MARPMQLKRSMRTARRGFTLVELMIVVAVIGVLAALAIYGLRKYQLSAGSSEAQSMLQNIRGAEEAWRAENLSYGGCKTGTAAPSLNGTTLGDDDLFPRKKTELDTSGDRKVAWGAGFTDATVVSCFKALAIRSDGPVRFSYGVLAGSPGVAAAAFNLPGGTWNKLPPALGTPLEPWYLAVAIGDRDLDGQFSRFSSGSWQSDVYVDEDTE